MRIWSVWKISIKLDGSILIKIEFLVQKSSSSLNQINKFRVFWCRKLIKLFESKISVIRKLHTKIQNHFNKKPSVNPNRLAVVVQQCSTINLIADKNIFLQLSWFLSLFLMFISRARCLRISLLIDYLSKRHRVWMWL